MIKPLTTMLKKNIVFTWTKEGKANFGEIKEAVALDPLLVNPNFDKVFIIYALGGDSKTSIILMQLNDENIEQPIAFFSKGIEECKDRYNYVERQVISTMIDLKKFKHLLTHNRESIS